MNEPLAMTGSARQDYQLVVYFNKSLTNEEHNLIIQIIGVATSLAALARQQESSEDR